MNQTSATPLAPQVQKFFPERLISQLGANTNTIASYCDFFRTLHEYAEVQCRLTSTDMVVPDIDAEPFAKKCANLAKKRQMGPKTAFRPDLRSENTTIYRITSKR